ncbi:MAG: hypothetical protein KGR98_01455, partial [Verrucomicrobia bacterium]|nr:hypothetical protein [Verrucomicrobiota bacterium]
MKTPIRTTGTSSSLRFIVTAMLSLCAAGTGFAQLVTNTWTGQGANVFWTTPGNWSGQNVPANGAVIIFTGPANLANSNNLTLGSYANSITFQAPAGPFILGNREFSVTNAISDSQIGTPETITVPLIITNLITINVTNGGEVDLLGTVTGTNGALDITGGGTVALTGITTNVFNGTSGVEVDGSTVAPAADLSLGTTNDLNVAQVGRLILNDGSLEGRVTNLVINPNRGISLGPTSGTGWGGFYVHAGNVLSYGGVITNNGTSSSSLSKAGYGTLDLFGANGFSGSTTNGIGVVLLDYTMPTSPTGNIIPSGSALTIGGGNAAGALNGAENVAELVMGGGAGADSQAFSSTFSTFGSSLIVATNGAGTVNLDLGALSHQAGGTLTFVTPEASGGGHVHTSTSNVNGILGGWALISGDHNTETFYTEPANGGGNHNNGLAHTVFISTNYAAVNASGDIVNYTNWFVATNTSTLAQQLVGMPETNIYFDGASANVLTVTNDNSGVTVDVNTITMSGTANGPGIFVGTNNTLRLGQFGGILLNSVGNNTYFIGGTNAAAQTGSGTHGSQDYGILTAGGPTLNTPGEIVIALDAGTGSSESAGSVIFETRITDNGTGPVTVVKTGPSSIKLDGHNTFSGGLYLLQGRVQFAGSELGSVTTTTNGDGGGSGNIYVLPGCYLFPSGIGADLITNHIFVAGGGDATEAFGTIRGGNFVGPISLIGDATIGCDTINISNGISGPYNLTFGALSRAGTVNLGGPQELLNPDNWTGNTILSAGGSSSPGSTLRENESGLIPHGIGYGNVTMTNGNAGQIIWDLHGNSETINGLNSYGVAARCFITNSVGTQSSLTVGDNDQSGIFGDAISGNIALAKIGAGVEVLTNIDNYTGNTTVSNGVLALVGSSSILNSPVVDIEGGTFDVSGESSYGFGVSQVVDVNNATLRILTASGGSVNMTNGVL